MFKYLMQLSKESAIYGFSIVAMRVFQFILLPIYTNLFSTEDFGVLGLVTTSMSLVQIFVVLALDAAAYRWFYSDNDIHDQKRTITSWVYCQFFLSIILGGIIFEFSQKLSVLITGTDNSSIFFQLSAIALPFIVFSSVVQNWFRFQRKPTMAIMFTLISSLITISLIIYFIVIIKIGLKGVFLGQLLAYILTSIIAIFIMKDWLNPVYFNFTRLKEMLSYSFPLIPAGLASWTVNLSGRYFIQAFSTNNNEGLYEVGLYQFGSMIAIAVSLVTSAFQQAWGPFALSIHKNENAKQVYASVFSIYIIVTSILSTGLGLFSSEIITIISNENFQGASTIIGVLGFGYVFIGIGYIANIGPTIAKNMKPFGLATIIAAIVNIFLNILLVPRMGKMGSALATLISQAIIPLYVFYYGHKIYPTPYKFFGAFVVLTVSMGIILTAGYLQVENLYFEILIKLSLIFFLIPVAVMVKILHLSQFKKLFLIIFGQTNFRKNKG